MHTSQMTRNHIVWPLTSKVTGWLSWDLSHEPTWLTADVSPLLLLKKAVAIFAVALLLGVAYPGVAAYLANVFYEDQVIETIRAKPSLKKQADAYNEFEARQKSIAAQITKVESYLATMNLTQDNLAQVERAVSLRKTLEDQKNAAPPIRLSAFYLGSTMHLWPAMFTFLGCLIFMFPPPLERPFSKTITLKRALLLAGIIVLVYRWPTWFRNTPYGQEGRISYGSNNIDVDPLGFFVQESLGFMVALLVAVTFLKWFAYYFQVKAVLASVQDKDPITELLKPGLSERLAHMFLHWQISSILLTLGFVWYTIFFWQMVIVYKDMRYTPHAVIVHSMWIMAWIAISLPLLITSYHWYRVRGRAMAALVKSEVKSDCDPDRAAAALDRLQPVSSWNVAASSVAVVGSLLAPFIKHFF
jgi:hypothetical protein